MVFQTKTPRIVKPRYGVLLAGLSCSLAMMMALAP